MSCCCVIAIDCLVQTCNYLSIGPSFNFTCLLNSILCSVCFALLLLSFSPFKTVQRLAVCDFGSVSLWLLLCSVLQGVSASAAWPLWRLANTPPWVAWQHSCPGQYLCQLIGHCHFVVWSCFCVTRSNLLLMHIHILLKFPLFFLSFLSSVRCLMLTRTRTSTSFFIQIWSIKSRHFCHSEHVPLTALSCRSVKDSQPVHSQPILFVFSHCDQNSHRPKWNLATHNPPLASSNPRS